MGAECSVPSCGDAPFVDGDVELHARPPQRKKYSDLLPSSTPLLRSVGLSNRSVRAPPVQQHTARDIAQHCRCRRADTIAPHARSLSDNTQWRWPAQGTRLLLDLHRAGAAALGATVRLFLCLQTNNHWLFGGHTSRTTKSCASACQCLRHTPSLAFASRPAEGTTARLAGGRSIVSPRSRDTAVTRWVADYPR